MITAIAKSLAVRASLGTCLASLVVLVPRFHNCFSEDVQSLLVNAPLMAIFCAGRSQEETIMFTMQAFLGTIVPICLTSATYWCHGYDIGIYSWQAVVLLLAVSCFGAATCLLPFDDNVKMYIMAYMPYFVMGLFKESAQSWYVGFECLALTAFGALCLILSFVLPIPGVQDVRALEQASSAFEDVANGCATIINEATAIFLDVGAGKAWRALARSKLSVLARRLEEARAAVECHHYSPAEVIQCLTRGGRLAARAWRRRRGEAFHAASEVLRACRLLSELAAQTRGWNESAAAVCRDAKEQFDEVANCAAKLLRDVARTAFQQRLGSADLRIDDVMRQELHAAAEKALASSREVASELLKMHEYNCMEVNSQFKGEFAMAFTQVQTFLFLMHSLVTDLLHSAKRRDEDVSTDTLNQFDLDQDSQSVPSTDRTYLRAMSTLLATPLLSAEGDMARSLSITAAHGGLQAFPKHCCNLIGSLCGTCYGRVVSVCKSGTRRWRLLFKIALSFAPACFACVYFFDFDSTMACTVGGICTIGSAYDGGSLRRSILRSSGIATGIAVGSMSEKVSEAALRFLASDVSAEVTARIILKVCMVFCWVYAALLPYFTGGPYGYLGMCAAFTALKFVVHPHSSVPLHVSTLIEYNMYACLLVVAVEMGVLRVKASILLKERLTAALAGISAALASLLSQDDTQFATVAAITPKTATEALTRAKDMANSHCSDAPPRWNVSHMRDLTPELRKAGVYDKYLKWREGYMRWRQGDTLGCHGELTGNASSFKRQRSPTKDKPPKEESESGRRQCSPSREESESSSAAAPRREPEKLVESTGLTSDLEGLQGQELPDLTQRLQEDGLYETYLAYKAGYLEWRKGGSHGSHGELTGEVATKKSQTNQLQVLATVSESEDEQSEDGKLMWSTPLHRRCRTTPDPKIPKIDSSAQLELAFSPDIADDGLEAISGVSLPNTDQEQPSFREGTCNRAESIRLVGDEPGFVSAVFEWGTAEGFGRAPSLSLEQMPALKNFVKRQCSKEDGHYDSETSTSIAEREARHSVDTVDPPSAFFPPVSGPSSTSLAEIQKILEESAQMLIPTEVADLAAQASERLDAEPFDSRVWLALTDAIFEMWMQVTLLAHVSLRLRHEVNLTKLLGGSDAEEAAAELVRSCSSALRTAIVIVDGGGAALDSSDIAIAALDEGLRNSSAKLASAIARPSVMQPAHGRKVTVQVLAGTAASALSMILDKVAETLSWSAVLAGSSNAAPRV